MRQGMTSQVVHIGFVTTQNTEREQ